MDHTLEEQTLLATFRQLDSAGKKELLDFVALLMKQHRQVVTGTTPQSGNQCSLEKPEKRPEAAKEPIFTE